MSDLFMPVSLTSAEFQHFLDTIHVYSDPIFAEMYFEKWRNDLPGLQLEAFSRQVGIGGKVLDAGCGPGHHTSYLQKLGHDTVGIDLSNEALKLARASSNGPVFLRANMLDTVFAEDEFSGVWACASVMHLPQSLLRSQLVEFRRVLAPGGSLALTVTVEQESHTDAFGRFFQSYPESYLIEEMSKVGLQVEERDQRIRAKTTEQEGRAAGWVTFTARKLS